MTTRADRVGFGTDVHRLIEGRPLILGGTEIEAEFGAEGHSDADALTHAITDAIFGALALGDIGTHFPDNDPRWENADSLDFLSFAAAAAGERGYAILNIDATVHLERPKLRPYIEAIRTKIATAASVKAADVSVKAKTGEGLGDIGTGRAVKAEAIVLLRAVE